MSKKTSAIKKISVNELKVGMFLHDLNCGWMQHPFMRNRFLLSSETGIKKIVAAGIKEVYIDTGEGLDVSDAPTREEVRASIEREMVNIASTQAPASGRVALAEELKRARPIKAQAQQLMVELMRDARMGKAIKIDCVQPVVQNVTESIFRNSGALIGLLRIKSRDDYTFLHSVGVCALMVAFCRSVGMDAEKVRQAGIGGLLHDIGKSKISDKILNKPGKLTDEEYATMQKHPEYGYEILSGIPVIGAIPLDITLNHHERHNGSGYPNRLAGDEISNFAQMAAIVDVYDAITSDRVYHKGLPAAEALRRIYEWSKFHFNPLYVHAFLRCVGIYPVGTLVLLESGRLAVVIENHENNLLVPKVNVFYNTKTKSHFHPQEIDLSDPFGPGGGDRIVGYEDADKWKVDPLGVAGLA